MLFRYDTKSFERILKKILIRRINDESNFDAFVDTFADEKKLFFLMMQLMLSIVTIYSYKHEV